MLDEIKFLYLKISQINVMRKQLMKSNVTPSIFRDSEFFEVIVLNGNPVKSITFYKSRVLGKVFRTDYDVYGNILSEITLTPEEAVKTLKDFRKEGGYVIARNYYTPKEKRELGLELKGYNIHCKKFVKPESMF